MSKYKYNLKLDEKDDRDWLFKDHFTMLDILPTSVDLRDKMPSVYNQGNLGSCQSCALDGIVSYIHGNPFEPSHLYTYYNTRVIEKKINEDSGGTLKDTIQSIVKNGITDKKYWDYNISKFAEKPPKIAYDNSTDKLSNYYRVTSIDEAKQALAQGHLPYIGLVVYKSMESNECINTGVIPMPKANEQELGGHALVLVGYDDYITEEEPVKTNIFTTIFNFLFGSKKKKKVSNIGKFYVRNSWGNCGINKTGYFSIEYDVFEKLLMDMWIVVS